MRRSGSRIPMREPRIPMREPRIPMREPRIPMRGSRIWCAELRGCSRIPIRGSRMGCGELRGCSRIPIRGSRMGCGELRGCRSVPPGLDTGEHGLDRFPELLRQRGFPVGIGTGLEVGRTVKPSSFKSPQTALDGADGDLTAQLASDPAGQAGAGRLAPEGPLGNPEQNRAVGQAVAGNRHDREAEIIAERPALPAAHPSPSGAQGARPAVAVAVAVAVAQGGSPFKFALGRGSSRARK